MSFSKQNHEIKQKLLTSKSMFFSKFSKSVNDYSKYNIQADNVDEQEESNLENPN